MNRTLYAGLLALTSSLAQPAWGTERAQANEPAAKGSVANLQAISRLLGRRTHAFQGGYFVQVINRCTKYPAYVAIASRTTAPRSKTGPTSAQSSQPPAEQTYVSNWWAIRPGETSAGIFIPQIIPQIFYVHAHTSAGDWRGKNAEDFEVMGPEGGRNFSFNPVVSEKNCQPGTNQTVQCIYAVRCD